MQENFDLKAQKEQIRIRNIVIHIMTDYEINQSRTKELNQRGNKEWNQSRKQAMMDKVKDWL